MHACGHAVVIGSSIALEGHEYVRRPYSVVLPKLGHEVRVAVVYVSSKNKHYAVQHDTHKWRFDKLVLCYMLYKM